MNASRATPTAPPQEWTNWSRNQRVRPRAQLYPDSLDALRTALLEAPGRVRLVGAGHSFTALVPTEDTLISLDRMPPLAEIDSQAHTAWVGAGRRLRDLSETLHKAGLAFENLGDIDRQSLAGAASTATHGTGRTLPCLSAQITGVELLTAGGERLRATLEDDPDRLHAAQVSLGALGVITQARLALCPSYRLRRRVWFAPLREVLDSAEQRWAEHRNYEFFYIPFARACMCISHDLSDAEPNARAEVDDDKSVMLLKRVRDLARFSRRLRQGLLRTAMRVIPGEDTVGVSWQLLASDRNVPFNEMEYHLPADSALPVLEQVISYIENHRGDAFFPIEIRQTRADAAWLSPFQGGNRISIAVHSYVGEPFDYFFSALEPMFRRAGGRPHWGKLHSLAFAELAALYPDFERFTALRRELDPRGLFLNRHTARLWGEPFDG